MVLANLETVNPIKPHTRIEVNTSGLKYLGKVYTPKWIVDHMLRPLFGESLECVKVCDPACGEGDFLAPIVEEICKRMAGATALERAGLRATLEYITGYDVDGAAVRNCRQKLTKIVNKILGWSRDDSQWCIHHADALDVWKRDQGTFDWVVGNPPYVRIQHLEADRREKIRSGGWKYFRGACDMYIIFFELGLHLLKDQGKLIFISPSGWLRNDAGKVLRKSLELNHGIRALYDFGNHQVFPGVSTYTCISHICKGNPDEKSAVYRYTGNRFNDSYRLVQSDSGWGVADPASVKPKPAGAAKLRDIADIHVGIQTLADRVFILEVLGLNEEFVIVQADGRRFPVEKKAVRRILKASVMKQGQDKIERIVIYPYDCKGKLLPEEAFKEDFPLAYAWLLANKARLLARDKGTFNSKKWFGFGREVGIRSAQGEKIITSGMNPSPNFQICEDPETLFYSGYCIKPRLNIDLGALLRELNSPAMAAHVQTFAQPFRGGWYSYAKRYIQDFPVSPDLIRA
ncbi:MAG: N-6 DNA methylase [Rhodothermaceae bacterium]|nr:N-6 DNA methylase [Rhodothermaceae bacterium]MYD18543.1 N-6 DNA methylase [Rhodothermaceae bacterium]MYI42547.1 N-6 DNA methylase [Rhodothermaceae bacterium]